jgi:hypothetical protein
MARRLAFAAVAHPVQGRSAGGFAAPSPRRIAGVVRAVWPVKAVPPGLTAFGRANPGNDLARPPR